MIEVVNRKKHSVQLIVRSKVAPKAFTTLNIPGVGAGHNVVYLPDEMVIDEQLKRCEKMGWISSKKQVTNKPSKGE